MRRIALLALIVAFPAIIPGPSRTRPEPEGRSGSQVRLENDHVRVLENLYEPGEESALHTHASPRVVYVLDGGELELEADSTLSRVRLEPGQTLWRPAETHIVRNVGRTSVRVLETEVKAATD